MSLGHEQATAGRREYWEDRLARDFDLEGVGYNGLGRAFNAEMYRVRREGFARLAGPLVATGNADVLDVGSGTGFYVELWAELGARTVTGSDMTATAVDALSRRDPAHRFVLMDIGAPELPLEPASFDAVSAMDVLFHIVDDAAHARAIANLGRLVKPGGHVLLTENLYREAPPPAAHQAGRSETTILARLAEAGLVVERRAPMFVLMNAPTRSQSRLHRLAWARLVWALSRWPALGGPVGRLMRPLETALVRRRRNAPSTELLLCRRI